ncbi:MAG: hypothetical protein HFH96_04110 [Lachnospiraceae bacterium]|jgi:hypothetical protein|nr:hypothetical protein [uncultured Acetatifactor sp.]MCI9230286.1 hypothetical protein [Lachnospiraceae bacterium]
MISDFISLSLVEKKEDTTVFLLELPDIYNDDEDVMSSCGRVIVRKDKDGFYLINITLDENFEKLSEGEIYDRDALIESVMINLKIQTDISYALVDAILVDNSGEYKCSF